MMNANLISVPNVRRVNFTLLSAPQIQKIELPMANASARRKRTKRQETPQQRAEAYPLSDAQLTALPEQLQAWYLAYLQGASGPESVGINTLRRAIEKALDPAEVAAREFHATNPEWTVCKHCNELLDWGWCSRCGEYR